MITDIDTYNSSLLPSDQKISDTLRAIIDTTLKGAESKIWHGHPVWFINGNPIVGYSKLKDSVRLLFWSGQSFDEPSLIPEGSFKAADLRFTDSKQIIETDLKRYLEKSIKNQWDYKNIVKHKGKLLQIVKA